MRNDADRPGAAGRAPLFRATAVLVGLAAGLSAAALSTGGARDAHPCGADLPCLVEGGAYLVRPPAGWDGGSALPAVVFFHGWMQSARDVMRDDSMVRVMSDLSVLLVAPDGVGHTWSFPGSPGHYRDEFAFVRAMLDDVEARFPVDTRRMLLRSPCRTRVRRLNARGGAVRSSLIRWGEKCPRPWPEALPRQRSRRAA